MVKRVIADYPALGDIDHRLIFMRFTMLKLWNHLLATSLPYLHLMANQPSWSFGGLLKGSAHLIFADVKTRLLFGALDVTRTVHRGGGSVSVRFDRSAAQAR